MDKPIRYESIQDPLDEDERELMDPNNWDWENSVEAVIAENPLAVFPIKVTLDEHRAIARAARAEGLPTGSFIKRAALDAAHASQPETQDSAETPRAATG